MKARTVAAILVVTLILAAGFGYVIVFRNMSTTVATENSGPSTVSCEVDDWTGGPGTVSSGETASFYSGVYTSYNYTTTTDDTHTVGYVTQVTIIEDPGNWDVTACTYLP
jgi:hypothetical protein